MRAFNLQNHLGEPFLTAKDTSINFTGDVTINGNVITTSGKLDEEISKLQAEIESLQGATFKFVDKLPTTGESNVIYLVPKASSKSGNTKDEYIWVNNAWELIGNTEIDVSGKQDKLLHYSEREGGVWIEPANGSSIYIGGPLVSDYDIMFNGTSVIGNDPTNSNLVIRSTSASIFVDGPLYANDFNTSTIYFGNDGSNYINSTKVAKLDKALTTDDKTTSVTSGSTKVVTSGAVYSELSNKQSKLKYYTEDSSSSQGTSNGAIFLTPQNNSVFINGPLVVTQRLDVRDKITINDANQSAALNSGITSTKVSSYDSHLNNSSVHVTTSDKSTWNNKQDKLSFIREEAGGVVIDDGYLITGELMSTSFYVAGPVKFTSGTANDYFECTLPSSFYNVESITFADNKSLTLPKGEIQTATLHASQFISGPLRIQEHGNHTITIGESEWSTYIHGPLYVDSTPYFTGPVYVENGVFDKNGNPIGGGVEGIKTYKSGNALTMSIMDEADQPSGYIYIGGSGKSTTYFNGPVWFSDSSSIFEHGIKTDSIGSRNESSIFISGPVVSNSTIAADTIESTIYYLGPAALTYIPDSGGGVVKLDNSTFKSYGMETNSLYVNGPAFLSGDLTFDKTSIYVDGPDGLRKGSLLVTPAESDIVIPQTWLNGVSISGIARTTSEIGPRYIQAVKNFRFTIQPGTSATDLISIKNTSGYALVITYNLIFYSDKTYSVRGIIHGLHYGDAFYVGDIIQMYFPKISGWTFPTYADSQHIIEPNYACCTYGTGGTGYTTQRLGIKTLNLNSTYKRGFGIWNDSGTQISAASVIDIQFAYNHETFHTT